VLLAKANRLYQQKVTTQRIALFTASYQKILSKINTELSCCCDSRLIAVSMMYGIAVDHTLE